MAKYETTAIFPNNETATFEVSTVEGRYFSDSFCLAISATVREQFRDQGAVSVETTRITTWREALVTEDQA